MFLKKILKLCLFCFVIALATNLLSLNILASEAENKLPILNTEVAQAVPFDYEEVFFVYFRYGNPTTVTTTPDLSVSLELQGQGFEIDFNWVHDLYYKIDTNQSIPQIPICSNEYDGLDYPISKNLFENERKLVYGPRSATTLLEPSGESKSELPPRATGCLRIGLRVSKNAVIGQSTRLIFNPDINNSSPEKSPGIQTIELFVGSLDEVCKNNEEFVKGTCQPVCDSNQIRNKEGVCVDLDKLCPLGLELFDGKCVTACTNAEIRNEFGICVEKQRDSIYFLNQIWTVPLLGVFLIIGWLFGKKTLKKIKNLYRKNKFIPKSNSFFY